MRALTMIAALLLWTFSNIAYAARQPAKLISEYKGNRPTEFAQAYDQIRLWVSQSQLEVSSKLGLFQYREGFQFPISIRFEDDAPAGLENSLAYVRLGRNADGFVQELVINLSDMSRQDPRSWSNLQNVFYHEMTHAVLNDAVGGDAALKVPRWVQEGLAQYIAGEGEPRMKETAGRYRKMQIRQLSFDGQNVPPALAYPAWYLTVRYLEQRHSINAVQALVRNLVDGKSMEDAIYESTSLRADLFYQNVGQYTRETLIEHARPDWQ